MPPELLIYPLLAHISFIVFLYVLLTIFRAPVVWNIGVDLDGENPWKHLEPRLSANLKNQFEWPMLFYVICVLVICTLQAISAVFFWTAWLFIFGRVIHFLVQVFTNNIRLRGVLFTINFLAVLALWFMYYLDIT